MDSHHLPKAITHLLMASILPSSRVATISSLPTRHRPKATTLHKAKVIILRKVKASILLKVTTSHHTASLPHNNMVLLLDHTAHLQDPHRNNMAIPQLPVVTTARRQVHHREDTPEHPMALHLSLRRLHRRAMVLPRLSNGTVELTPSHFVPR